MLVLITINFIPSSVWFSPDHIPVVHCAGAPIHAVVGGTGPDISGHGAGTFRGDFGLHSHH